MDGSTQHIKVAMEQLAYNRYNKIREAHDGFIQVIKSQMKRDGVLLKTIDEYIQEEMPD